MDGTCFDTMTRRLSLASSRRRALGGVLLGALGLVGMDAEPTTAKKKPCPPCKKRKKGKCKGTLPDGSACDGGQCQGGACVALAVPPGPPPASPPPTPGPTCSDGIKNGRETDVDCGGPDCPPCALDQVCIYSGDCRTGNCDDRECEGCSSNFNCGFDPDGARCTCVAGICYSSGATGETCQASATCGSVDACMRTSGICGHGGKCYLPLGGGAPRCATVAPASCGCTSHQQCAAAHGAGAYCVTFDPEFGFCTCGEGGPTTFCAIPA